MKYLLSTFAAVVLLMPNVVDADDRLARPGDKAGQAMESSRETEDCSKQVWPHFSPSCLRHPEDNINVRLVTTDRRSQVKD